MRKLFISLVTAGLLSVSGLAHAFSFSADGNLSEWGVTPGAWSTVNGSRVNGSDWTPDAGIASKVEDYDPAGNGYLNPGWGGQLYDAEAMYAKTEGGNLYYAIVTGHPPSGDPANGLYPGDIAFDFGADGSYEYGIETGSAGRLAGGLYSVKVWNYSFGAVTEIKEVKTNKGDNGLMGSGSFAYTGTNYAGDHYVIEGSIPLSAFGSSFQWGKKFTISWTETCGNDLIKMNVTPTPEPATMALFGIGLAGMGLARKRKMSV